ncbi:uncharacterized protein OCT59_007203 [Rhizophagus irregularis]|uniref:uncharacterized protein n=1 Tax=Rhizophagus irregularis TaxID=588596 RepID=UPI0019F18815|nr:hypothetical protein OCT59_007203 [Rhizophagus irregularis]GBC32899.2 hypothetical protein GLOIN_2v1658942 [Rhizophagus irregularis DAOM 181602=DAOM 197198]
MFDDSSILLHMRKQRPIDDSSLDDHFIIRILDSNSETHQIKIFDEEIKEAENTFILTNKYILLTYYKINDMMRYGMICNQNGEILTKTKGLVLGGSKVSSFSNVIVNVNPEVSFLWLTGIYNPPNGISTISWIVFSMPTSDENIINKNIAKLGNDSISSEGEIWTEYKGFPTIDGGYGIAFIGRQPGIDNNETLNLNPEWLIYVIFLKHQTYERMELSQIYQANLGFNTMTFRECNLAYDNGYICIISVSSLGVPIKSGEFVISFLSSGAVVGKGINQFNIDDQIPPGRQYNIDGVVSLVYGGFAIILQNIDDNSIDNSICYSPNGQSFLECKNLPKKFQKGKNGSLIYGLLSNNTLWIVQDEILADGWSIYFFDLRQYVVDVHGYGNPYIESTSPEKDSKINSTTDKITINFTTPIVLSSNDISIYQVNQPQDILRQRTSAKNSEYVHLINKNLTIIVDVLSSTFNMQETYYVLMDNNFVKNITNNEPKIGIKKNKWSFNTTQLKEYKYAESAIVSISLDESYSRVFDDFTSQERRDFLVNLQNKLCQIIPVGDKQLKFTGKYRKDSSISQIQLALNIDNIDNGRNIKSIIDDLDTLIRNKDITQISMVERVVYLDKDYGCKHEPNIIDQLRDTAIIVFPALFLVASIYFISRWWCKNKNKKDPKECHNRIIISIAVILSDVVFDSLFTINDSVEVNLYIPSLVFFVVPLIFNLVIIITKEIKDSSEFRRWFKDNSGITIITATLATINIKMLNIISSNFGGFNFFNARFSEKTEKIILCGGFISFMIEDLPQLVIQILYSNRTIAWNIIPLLSLISNGFIFVMDIYEYWFEIYHHIQGKVVNKNSSNSSTKLDEDSLETSLAITLTNSISIVNKEIANNDDIEKNDESNVNEISPAEDSINYDEKMNKDANVKIQQQKPKIGIDETLNSESDIQNVI